MSEKSFFIASVCVDREKLESLQEKYGRVRTHRPCEHRIKLCFPKPANMTEYFRTECSFTFNRMPGIRHPTSRTTDITHTVEETLVDMEGYTYWQVIQLSERSTDERALPGAHEVGQHLCTSSLASSTAQLHRKMVSAADPTSTLFVFRMAA